MSTCRSCGAEVLWVKTEAGRSMPLDAVPVDPTKTDGYCVVVEGVARFGAVDYAPGTKHYVSHFATCPNSAKHRKAE